MAVTKDDIVGRIHEVGFSKKQSVDLVETLIEVIKDSLAKSEDVLISGFGNSVSKEEPAPRTQSATGEDLMLRERRVITFKCSGKLRNKINGMSH
jgi:integration host factor subunit alpha